jgi:hypothetical protein
VANQRWNLAVVPELFIRPLRRLTVSAGAGRPGARLWEAVRIHLYERKKRDMREQMKRGYQQMACLNLSLAEEGPIFETDPAPLGRSRPHD